LNNIFANRNFTHLLSGFPQNTSYFTGANALGDFFPKHFTHLLSGFPQNAKHFVGANAISFFE